MFLSVKRNGKLVKQRNQNGRGSLYPSLPKIWITSKLVVEEPKLQRWRLTMKQLTRTIMTRIWTSVRDVEELSFQSLW